ncbi:MAG TPA: NmrA/HSCARG family protein [Gemmatimonadaceae bacterium]|nr:NmrA/HSCARG family protein [Gemmatimonadaceae bacterium]
MTRQTITVVGGTGAQGGGVVDALLDSGEYAVRVVSRNPASESAQALERRGVQVVKGDLLQPNSLRAAFDGAHGAFLVTNFWDPTQMPKEVEIGNAAVTVARAAGVEHFIWSTLPDAEKLTGGRVKLPHFTGKAKVDATVQASGFPRHTFVQAPFYFQNFLGALAPQPLPSGGRGWAVPMDPAARVIHGGDVHDVGRAVAAAFAAGDTLPNGSYLAVCGGMYSWNDFVSTLNAQGDDVQVQQVPGDAYDTFFPGASEVREMFQYFEQCTYFGPESESRIAAANALYPAGYIGFSDWANRHLAPANTEEAA